MLRRSLVAIALCVLAGCQDYNFNPVGKCVIQPGSSRVTLSNVSTADILFVVDDSGSMAPEQARLAKNFRAFIDALAAAQAARINQDGLDPFEFHIAVTTSSIFEAWQTNGTVACGGTPATCDVIQTHYGTTPSPIACDTPSGACDELLRSYFFQTTDPTRTLTYCPTPGVAQAGTTFPAGDFIGAPGNAKVLHFTKDLDWAHWPAQPDPRITDLITQFQANINVGTCGSGMEQHLEAGYLAVKKALRQDGLQQVAGVAPADWPHAGAKLVVVWVGDEDDCSNPNDPLKSLAFSNALSAPGSDVCMGAERNGGNVTLADGRTVSQFPLSRYEDFFTGLGKTFSAAFVYSALKNADGSFSTGDINVDTNPPGQPPNLLCKCQCPPECTTCADNAADPICRTPATCGGNSHGNRINTFAKDLRGKGVETFEASVCDADWATTLQSIANLVKPQRGLNLPSQPATSDVAILRIETADADPTKTRFCQGPGAGLDWNFVDCTTGAAAAAGVTTSCITIDHTPGRTNTCCITGTSTCSDAKPGETYIMQYLGLVPAASSVNPQGGCANASECASQLGGASTDWQCFRTTASDPRGTCVCQGT